MNLHDSKHYSWYTTIFCDKLEQLPQNIKLIKTSFNLKVFQCYLLQRKILYLRYSYLLLHEKAYPT